MIGNLDIILAVHYIVSEVVSSGCLSRGTFSAQMELMVYWGGGGAGLVVMVLGRQRRGKGQGRGTDSVFGHTNE